VLASLRAKAPPQAMTYREALQVAECQADALLAAWGITEAPVPTDVVAALAHIRVIDDAELPVSGLTHWNGTDWVITLNVLESAPRRRFTLMHEFKHIIDHGRPPLAATRSATGTLKEPAEQVANFFAGCVLVPRHLLTQAWATGIQQPSDLARLFGVSIAAINVRTCQLGLIRLDRHGRLLFIERRSGERLGQEFRRTTQGQPNEALERGAAA